MPAAFDDLFMMTQEEIDEVRKKFNTNVKSIQADVESLKEWMKKNPHLPETDDRTLEGFLLYNKFSVERTKSRIDTYYTLKGFMPEFFAQAYPTHPAIKQVWDCMYWVTMPKLTPNMERVSIWRMRDSNPDIYEPLDITSYIYMGVELRYRYDYSYGDVLIFDFEGYTLNHLKKFTPTIMSRVNTLNKKAFSVKMKAIHILNAPSFVDIVLSLIKPILDAKIYNRIQFHKNYESLYKHVPKEILPLDYGGQADSLEDLNEVWKKHVTSINDFYVQLGKKTSNEKLRTGKPLENDILGFQGTFKQLTID